MKKILVWILVLMLAMPLSCVLGMAQTQQDTSTQEQSETLTEDSDEEAIRQQILQMLEEDEQQADVDTVEVGSDELMITQGLDDAWLNILLLGTDDRSSRLNCRTDSIIILSLNRETSEVKMTSIMRDVWVKLYKGGSQKINAANVFGGPNLAMRTVNEYFGMNIQYYALINMQGLTNVIDAVGGIELDISSGEKRWINSYLEDYRRFTGKNTVDQNPEGRRSLDAYGENTHLTGAQATAYCRNRYMGNDQQRTQRQRNVLMALASKAKDAGIGTLITLIPKIMESVQTNIPLTQMIELAMVAMNADLAQVQQERMPFAGTYQSGMFGTVWCIKPNFEENAKQLNSFIYGE